MEYTTIRRGALIEHRVAPRQKAGRLESTRNDVDARSKRKAANGFSGVSYAVAAILLGAAVLYAFLSRNGPSSEDTRWVEWTGWESWDGAKTSQLQHILHVIRRTRRHALATFNDLTGQQLGLVALGAISVCAILVRRKTDFESLTPLPGLGIQLSTTRSVSVAGKTLSTSTDRQFISRCEIDSVVIHEAPRRWNVIYYLGIVLKNGQEVVVAFEDVRPRLEALIQVYHAVQDTLFE